MLLPAVYAAENVLVGLSTWSIGCIVAGDAVSDDAPGLVGTRRTLERTMFHAGATQTELRVPALHLSTDTSVSRTALTSSNIYSLQVLYIQTIYTFVRQYSCHLSSVLCALKTFLKNMYRRGFFAMYWPIFARRRHWIWTPAAQLIYL